MVFGSCNVMLYLMSFLLLCFCCHVAVSVLCLFITVSLAVLQCVVVALM